MRWWRRHTWTGGEGGELRDRPAVREAMSRAPARFGDLFAGRGYPDASLSRLDLLLALSVTTTDGRHWGFWLGDEAKAVIDTGSDLDPEDLMETALRAQPGVVAAEHVERECYEVHLDAPVPADRALALYLDAVVDSHGELRRRLGLDEPGA
ncbi:hypothetical protein ACIA8K_37970 [Catenuloplanes sp. NPDC051500]|uniref:hypothetical protein n=1 Tax=Catenuloplanes sp. NPDC051500 TaxID=3363959 RepID=UPI0037B39816